MKLDVCKAALESDSKRRAALAATHPTHVLGLALLYVAAMGCSCSDVIPEEGGVAADGGTRDGGTRDSGLDGSVDGGASDAGSDGAAPNYGHAVTAGRCETLWTVYGREAAEHFGSQLLRVGDLDGDGVHDLAVSSEPGFGTLVSITLLSGATGGAIRRFEASANQVWSLTRGGDVDGDSIADFALVGRQDSPAMTTDAGFDIGGGSRTGAWAYSGGSGAVIWEYLDMGTSELGMGPVSDVNGDEKADFLLGNTSAIATGGQVQVLSGADGSVWETIASTGTSMLFGQGSLELGDIDGDGIADLVITDGLGPTTHIGGGVVHAISGRDRAVLWIATGEVVGSAPPFLGNIVAPEGVDLNDDGISDLATSEHNRAEDAGAETGRVVVLDGTTGARLWESPGTRDGEHFGSQLAFIGDQDGDGVEDLLASGPRAFSAMPILGTHGRVAILSGVDGATIVEIQGVPSEGFERSDGLGSALDGLGSDVNGDGRPDFVLGASNADLPSSGDIGAVVALSCAP